MKLSVISALGLLLAFSALTLPAQTPEEKETVWVLTYTNGGG